MNTRRKIIIALSASLLGATHGAHAQQARKMPQIGYVGNSTPTMEAGLVEGFREGLRERGYVEGKNVVIHYRWAEGKTDVFPTLIAELLALRVDIIVTSGTSAAVAAKNATTTTPIVLAAAGDPVGNGLVASLAHPGGNITGVSNLYATLEGKRMEVLRDILPHMRSIALLLSPANPLTPIIVKSVRTAAELLRISVQPYEVRGEDDFERVFSAIAKSSPDAMAVQGDRVLMLFNRTRIVQFAATSRLPTMYGMPEFVAEGGLVYYGPDTVDMFRSAAVYVDKILRGALPAELPLEQPTKFQLMINLKTAKALGLTIPHSLLVRADEVIQ
jgi:putative ABC transport system substrate-binding protein